MPGGIDGREGDWPRRWSHTHRELLAAGAALAEANPGGLALALQSADLLPTVRNLIDSDQLWREVLPQAIRGGPALFLDRDGVVVVETDYLCRPQDVALIPGAAEVIAAANRGGISVVIVTNQAGIGRGKFVVREERFWIVG
jgi:hypothetical protein